MLLLTACAAEDYQKYYCLLRIIRNTVDECCLLRCNAVQSGRKLSSVQRNALPSLYGQRVIHSNSQQEAGGGSKFIRNVSKRVPDCKAAHLR
jgi:hypothetical protein